MRLQIIIFAISISALACPLTSTAELIEPTRTLQETSNAPGDLTILSEPPDLDVTLDDNHIGKTPIFSKRLESGLHKLQIHDSETEIYVEPDKTVQISLFKVEFILLPALEIEAAKQQAPEDDEVDEARTRRQPAPEERKDALTPWDRFVNGTLNHF